MSTRDTTNGAAGVAGPPRFGVLKKFLYVGLGVKRWLLLGAIGIGVCAVGLAFVLKNILDLDVPDFLPWFWEGVLVGVFGVSIILASVYGLYRTLRPILFASATINRLTDTIYTRRSRGRGPKIVTIGGGTGLSVLLRGIKTYTDNISAIITVADDGGSSGRLRKELGMLPPGDFRNCLVAMTDDESLVGKLFQHRFDQGDSLEGHSFGNLFIAAMTEVTGSFEEALYESSKVLAIHGRVLPSTMTNLSLSARLADGSVVRGESTISKQSGRIDRIMIEPENAGGYEKAVEAIREAQLVLVGPGSLYTSILPNLLVPGISEALRQSSAPKVYVCNVATQVGETDGYTVAQHLAALQKHTFATVVDYAVYNDWPVSLGDRFPGEPVVNDGSRIEGVGLIGQPLVDSEHPVRHDSIKLAEVIMDVYHGRRTVAESAPVAH